VRSLGHDLEDVLACGETLFVRRTANLHTGGTIHDVTDEIDREVIDACITAARAIDIPVVGLDLILPDGGRDFRFIEANERPGLANHQPQPTAECFIDMLFPHAHPRSRGGEREDAAMPNEHIDTLRQARDELVRDRRLVAQRIAKSNGPLAVQNAPCLTTIQSAIEAIDRAILDEQAMQQAPDGHDPRERRPHEPLHPNFQ